MGTNSTGSAGFSLPMQWGCTTRQANGVFMYHLAGTRSREGRRSPRWIPGWIQTSGCVMRLANSLCWLRSPPRLRVRGQPYRNAIARQAEACAPRSPGFPRHAFTLIELLVSITIAVSLSGVAFIAFQQSRQVATRNQALTAMAVESGHLYRRMSEDIASTLPGSSLQIDRRPLATSVFASPDYPAYALRLITQIELPLNAIGSAAADPLDWKTAVYPQTLVYVCWEWRPPNTRAGEKTGSLWTGRSTAANQKTTKTLPDTQSYVLQSAVAARRSRLRPFDDNDLRLLNNASVNATVSSFRTLGDLRDLCGEDLDLDGTLDAGVEDADGDTVLDPGQLAKVSAQVKTMTFALLSLDGSVTTLTPQNGVTPAGGTAWWSGELRRFDGLWRDGRTTTADGTQTVLSARPALLRVQWTLLDPGTGIETAHGFSIPLGREVPYASCY